jgi:hypothetical protein
MLGELKCFQSRSNVASNFMQAKIDQPNRKVIDRPSTTCDVELHYHHRFVLLPKCRNIAACLNGLGLRALRELPPFADGAVRCMHEAPKGLLRVNRPPSTRSQPPGDHRQRLPFLSICYGKTRFGRPFCASGALRTNINFHRTKKTIATDHVTDSFG